MHHEKGKPINTSVPSIAIRFNANAEAIEELYQSEEESVDKSVSEKSKSTGASDPESSPLRSYLRLGKRSTSIDNSLTAQDSSPPSDPWKFFSDIKGKITKSVEDTFTEIKHRNQEGKTPVKETKDTKESKDTKETKDTKDTKETKDTKDSKYTKDNSSLSDSEDLSESSLSKTCGIVSTTEGVEMSTDDETPSLEKDKKLEEAGKKSEESLQGSKLEKSISDVGLRRRYRLSTSSENDRETSISVKSLAHLYELNTGLKLNVANGKHSEDVSEVESGVEAFEDEVVDSTVVSEFNVDADSTSTTSDVKSPPRTYSGEDLLTSLAHQIENFEVDEDNCINIRKVSGTDIQQAVICDEKPHTFFAPEGFVDLRKTDAEITWYQILHKYRQVLGLSLLLLFYFIFSIPVYISGFVAGVLFTLSLVTVYNKIFSSQSSITDLTFSMPVYNSQTILEIPAVKEYQPVAKFEGWMNEYPETYDPQTYHISQTQSVYVKLQGNLLRVSHTRSKIPKRAVWNEPKHKLVFLHHRIYNLLDAKVMLLPDGLNKKRHWSKKYPICVVLNKDQTELSFTESNIESEDEKKSTKSTMSDSSSVTSKKSFFSRKKKVAVSMWQISLLHYLAFRYTVILLLVIHWATCLQYAIPKAIGLLHGSLSPDSWIIKSQINNYTSNYNRYLRCLFRACCFLLNITHGPYDILTVEDILIAVLSLLVGTILAALLLVLILQIVSSVVSAETKYQEIMNQVQEYMGYKQLPINMQRRLIAFYEYKFQKSYFREGAITATLSERLRREINVFCYRRLVDSVSIFQDMPQHIIVDIVNSLKPEIFLPNDIIVKAGTIGECMYFLASGTVCVVTPTGREPQIFSKLTEEDEEFEMESESSRPSSPSPRDDHSPDLSDEKQIEEEEVELNEILKEDLEDDVMDDIVSLADWTTYVAEENGYQTRLYLFGRTDREKEDWFRRFTTATHRGAYNLEDPSNNDTDVKETISNTLLNAEKNESDYLKYMAQLHKTKAEVKCDPNVLWINALLGRILYDCTRDDNTTKLLVKDRIQRKLSSIKLPYFIEQLLVTELSLGSSPPIIHKASKPVLDQRGLWIDLDITYDGTVVLNLQTKLNLMKLKQPTTNETVLEPGNSSAKWLNSDVDDTAESSTDDEVQIFTPKKVLDDVGNPVTGLGGSSNASKKIIKMVDKIAESKFFQAATENRYIKKAMEGVSNTELGLKVEVKGLIGTLVLNIPPPPSDRIWIGFRPTPRLHLSAQPIVGDRNFGFLRQLTTWIEKKLSMEFQKVLVIPNMEDILISVMSQKLPE